MGKNKESRLASAIQQWRPTFLPRNVLQLSFKVNMLFFSRNGYKPANRLANENWRSTYYHYMNNEEVFAEKMTLAKINRQKVVFSFLTVP